MALRRRIATRVRLILDWVFRPYLADTARGHEGIHAAIVSLHGDLGRLHREVEEIVERVRAIEIAAGRAAAIARHAYDEEPANRRRVNELRRSEEDELAFTESDPLVIFLVHTYNSDETLRDVALPSILSQTYSNLEVIVVGDCAPPETEQVIAGIGDPRVSYFNRTVRGPYPEDSSKRWYVIGTPPYNEALARAKGRWIAGLGDDDAIRPNHLESLLSAARENRFEHCYGRQQVTFAEGEPMILGEFPPVLGQWGLQAAVFHAGLRFFELELSDAIYDEPNDWSLCRRMLRAGVRFGMIDDVVVDKNETRRKSAQQWHEGSVPRVD
jgi:cellulose synthase/poly-beta-1,6-N-acetylglucosamine synthase-like glycosyltransferase